MAETMTAHDGPRHPRLEVEIVPKATWRSLFAFTTRKDLSTFAMAVSLTAVSGAAKPAMAIFIGRIFDHLGQYQVGESTSTQLLRAAKTWCLALTSLGIGLALLNGLFFGLWLLFGEKQARNARGKLFDAILRKAVEWFDLRSDGIGSLLIRIQTQIRELQSGTSQPLGFFFEDVATVIAGIGIAFYYSWKLTLVVLATIPVILVAVYLATRAKGGLQNAIESQKMKLGHASKVANTAISSIDTVKAFNGEAYEVARYQNAINSQINPYLDQAFINALQIGISAFGATAMFGTSFWYALNLVQHGLSAGKVVTTIYSCVMAAQAAEAVLPHWLILAKGMSAGKTLKTIIEEVEDSRMTSSMSGKLKPRTCMGDVEFRETTFAYPSTPDQLALDEVDLVFTAKQTTFIIGKSGSGKSTLSNLIVKFYEPLSGDIYVDGVPIHTLNTDWLRNNVTLVQQQSTLFDETLFQNIAFGQRSLDVVSKTDVVRACQTAALGDTLSNLPRGLETMVGVTENPLSGGQMQRVAIARARLRDSPILVLDEATSALDPESRSLVMESIRIWRRNKTTIIITHDVSQIKKYDFVYVLEKGKVVQEGSRSLIESRGAFRDFVSQAEVDPENPFSDSAEILRQRSAVNAFTGHFSNGVSEEALDAQDPTTEEYLSRFLMRNHMGQTGLSTRRISLGVGMGATYANALRAHDALEASEDQLLQSITTSTMQANPQFPPILEPRSTRPDNREVGGSIRRYRPEEIQEHFELVTLQGRATQENHREVSRLCLSRRSQKQHVSGVSTVATVTSSGRVPFVMEQDLYRPKQLKEKPKPKHVASLRQILGTVPETLTAKSRSYCILGLIFCAISASCTPGFAYTFARLLSTLNLLDNKLQSTEGRKWALLIIAIALIDGCSRFLFHYLAEYVAVMWVAKLRIEALRRILSQSKSWFSKSSSTSERLNECLDRNAEEMRNIVGRFLGLILYAGFMMSVAIIWALAVSWKLTLVGLSAVPVIYLLSRTFELASSKWERRLNVAASHSGAVFSETFSNIRVVRAFTLEDYFKKKQNHAATLTYRVGKRRAVCTGFFFGINDCTTQLVTALVLYYGCVIVTSPSHQWAVTEILTVAVLLLFSATSAAATISLIPQIGQSRATANYMLYLSHLPRNANHEAGGTKQLYTIFPLKLTNLNFSYPATKDHPSVPVLHDVNMIFEAGTSTAIVGSSGCGKSTIAALVLGFYPPSEPLHPGTPAITFAGNSIANLNSRSLRSQMAFVCQQPVLFPTTVAQNISYGLATDSPLNTLLNVTCAAQAAGIHETIMSLSSGYDTLLGDGGQGLSGGQAQRVAIARALVRRPKLLIMDEATSALDAESARGIRNLVAGLVKRGKDERMDGGAGMAVVVITHAVEMMRVVDKIVMLEGGSVVEAGGFDELMAHRGRFARLVRG